MQKNNSYTAAFKVVQLSESVSSATVTMSGNG